MAINRFECELLVTNASVLRRKSYVVVWVEGVFKHECFVLHTVARCFSDNDNSILAERVEALRPGDKVDVVVELVPRMRDNRAYLAFELIDLG